MTDYDKRKRQEKQTRREKLPIRSPIQFKTPAISNLSKLLSESTIGTMNYIETAGEKKKTMTTKKKKK